MMFIYSLFKVYKYGSPVVERSFLQASLSACVNQNTGSAYAMPNVRVFCQLHARLSLLIVQKFAALTRVREQISRSHLLSDASVNSVTNTLAVVKE